MVCAFLLYVCAVLGCDTVNSLPSSEYGAMFGDRNRAHNTRMLQPLLSRADTESKPFLLLAPPHPQAGWGCTRRWEVTQPGQMTPADQRDINTTWHHAHYIKLGNVLRNGALSSQVTIKQNSVLLSWEWPNICPWEVVDEFLGLVEHSFCFTSWSVSISIHSSHVYSSDSLSILTGEEWVGVWSGCQLRSNHNNCAAGVSINFPNIFIFPPRY